MKRVIIVLAAVLLTACSKEKGNSGVLKQETVVGENTKVPQEPTYRYVAEDGSSAHITYGQAPEGKYISIRSNNKTIRVKHEQTTASGDVYREHDITVTAMDSLVTIDQAGTIIELRKARGQ